MFDQNSSYQQDPLRHIGTRSGTVVTYDDICLLREHSGKLDIPPSVVRTEVLQDMKQVSLAVRSLANNPEFITFMKYLSEIKGVASFYAFNPTVEPAVKNVWFNQLSLVNGFENIVNDFRTNTPTHFQEILDEHLESLNYVEENDDE